MSARQARASAKRPLVRNHLPSKSTNTAFSVLSIQEIEAKDYMFQDNLGHPRQSLCLLSFHGGITLQSDRRLFTWEDVQKAKSVTWGEGCCKKFRGCPLLLCYPLAADGPESYFRCPRTQCPLFTPYPHISMPSAHCKCPTAVTNQREKHGQKAGFEKAKYDICIFGTRGEWIRLIS